MNYYYDIDLNFDMEHIWEFYEWDDSDVLSHIKKIPLFHVDVETITTFLKNQITINQEFVKELAHKTITRDSKEEIYAAFLMSDSKNTLACLLNEEGKVIALSKVGIKDDNNINEFMYTIRETKIPYEIKEPREKRNGLRQVEKLKQFIQVEINTLIAEKNIQKLKYLHYEWLNQEENDLKKMAQNLTEALKKPMNKTLEKIFYLIRLSYHQV